MIFTEESRTSRNAMYSLKARLISSSECFLSFRQQIALGFFQIVTNLNFLSNLPLPSKLFSFCALDSSRIVRFQAVSRRSSRRSRSSTFRSTTGIARSAR